MCNCELEENAQNLTIREAELAKMLGDLSISGCDCFLTVNTVCICSNGYEIDDGGTACKPVQDGDFNLNKKI